MIPRDSEPGIFYKGHIKLLLKYLEDDYYDRQGWYWQIAKHGFKVALHEMAKIRFSIDFKFSSTALVLMSNSA